jgi:hypothetical protein
MIIITEQTIVSSASADPFWSTFDFELAEACGCGFSAGFISLINLCIEQRMIQQSMKTCISFGLRTQETTTPHR